MMPETCYVRRPMVRFYGVGPVLSSLLQLRYIIFILLLESCNILNTYKEHVIVEMIGR